MSKNIPNPKKPRTQKEKDKFKERTTAARIADRALTTNIKLGDSGN